MRNFENFREILVKVVIFAVILGLLAFILSHTEAFARDWRRVTDDRGFTQGYSQETLSGDRYRITNKKGFTKGYVIRKKDYSNPSYEREKDTGYHTKWMNSRDKE